jgi:hypothetical protein
MFLNQLVIYLINFPFSEIKSLACKNSLSLSLFLFVSTYIEVMYVYVCVFKGD